MAPETVWYSPAMVYAMVLQSLSICFDESLSTSAAHQFVDVSPSVEVPPAREVRGFEWAKAKVGQVSPNVYMFIYGQG